MVIFALTNGFLMLGQIYVYNKYLYVPIIIISVILVMAILGTWVSSCELMVKFITSFISLDLKRKVKNYLLIVILFPSLLMITKGNDLFYKIPEDKLPTQTQSYLKQEEIEKEVKYVQGLIEYAKNNKYFISNPHLNIEFMNILRIYDIQLPIVGFFPGIFFNKKKSVLENIFYYKNQEDCVAMSLLMNQLRNSLEYKCLVNPYSVEIFHRYQDVR